MIIKKLTISNYRSIKDDNLEIDFAIPNGTPGSGLSIIVGANNVGKSNVYHALDLLFNNANPENIKNKQRMTDVSEIIVELQESDFQTSINEYVQANKRDVFTSLVFQEGGENKFKIRRKCEDSNGAIEIWDQTNGAYKNVAGIDAPVKKWLHFLPLWANTTTEEVADYSAKSIIGELFSRIIEEIKSDSAYQRLHSQFDNIFGSSGTSILSQKTASISTDVSALIQDQFDSVGVKFKADPPKIEQYVKQIKTIIDDGDETEISEKGNGLQRAIMIALIQIYARSLSTGASRKPFFLFIDEPELYLNPQSQRILLGALRTISTNEQVFIVTHSPYFIDWHDYTVGAKIGKAKRVNSSTKIFWLNNPSSYTNLLSDYVMGWQQPHLLDTAAKELLFSEKILFLEGQEDVGLIRKWAKDHNKTINFDIFGYGVGGFGKYTAFLNLADDLGLDKVAALYDMGVAETAKIATDSNINTSYKLIQLSAGDIRDKFDPCHGSSCTACSSRKYGQCGNKTQRKTGCFGESGAEKTGSSEYVDFCNKFDEIIAYFA